MTDTSTTEPTPVADTAPVERVAVTEAAAELIRRLVTTNGPVMFHQSGGCCDGSAPMCYSKGMFRTGGSDVLLEELRIDGLDEPTPFWMSSSQYELWKHTHITVDLVQGRGAGFSLEAPEGFRFLIRSRIFSDDEYRSLVDAGVLAA